MQMAMALHAGGASLPYRATVRRLLVVVVVVVVVARRRRRRRRKPVRWLRDLPIRAVVVATSLADSGRISLRHIHSTARTGPKTCPGSSARGPDKLLSGQPVRPLISCPTLFPVQDHPLGLLHL